MVHSVIDLLMPMGNISLLLNECSLIGLFQIDKGLNSISALILGFETKIGQ